MGAWINHLDRECLLWVHSYHHPALTVLMMSISYAGEAAVCWWGIGLYLFARRHPLAKQMLLAFVISLVIGVAFTNLPQTLWYRDRPYMYLEGIHALGVRWENSAFPSGHTVTSFGAAVIFGYIGLRARICLLVFAVLMGVSRVYAGMHHPSDVLCGAVSGMLCGVLSWKLAAEILRRIQARGSG